MDEHESRASHRPVERVVAAMAAMVDRYAEGLPPCPLCPSSAEFEDLQKGVVSEVLPPSSQIRHSRHECSSVISPVGTHIETSKGRCGPSRPPRLNAHAAMGGRRRCRVCPARVVAHPGHARECRGGLSRTRLPSVVLGMTRKALVCKCGLFSSLNGNLLQKGFHRHAEVMHARWVGI